MIQTRLIPSTQYTVKQAVAAGRLAGLYYTVCYSPVWFVVLSLL